MGWLDPDSLLHRLTCSAALEARPGGPAGALADAGPLHCSSDTPGTGGAPGTPGPSGRDAPATPPAATPAGSSFVADLLNWQHAHGAAEPAARRPGHAAR